MNLPRYDNREETASGKATLAGVFVLPPLETRDNPKMAIMINPNRVVSEISTLFCLVGSFDVKFIDIDTITIINVTTINMTVTFVVNPILSLV